MSMEEDNGERRYAPKPLHSQVSRCDRSSNKCRSDINNSQSRLPEAPKRLLNGSSLATEQTVFSGTICAATKLITFFGWLVFQGERNQS